MKQLTKKQITEIVNEVLGRDDTFDSTPFRHLKSLVRKMLIEAVQRALVAAQENEPKKGI